MNKRIILKTIAYGSLLTLGTGLLSACSEPKPQFHGVDITGADYGRDFPLADHNGQARSIKDFPGKVVMVFFGLDWVATVPPTVAICRERWGDRGAVVFGWVFASHQVGAAIAASAAGAIRDSTGEYTIAWFGAAGLCGVAAVISLMIRRQRATTPA